MADESDTGGTVKLDADTSPFEAALNRATAKFKDWGGKISSVLDKMNTYSATKIAAWSEKAGQAAGMSSEAVGEMAGGGIGAAIGVWFGGPAGALIGAKVGSLLGEQVGQNFDLTPVAAAFSGMLDGVKELGTQAKVEWDDILADGSETWGRIKEAWAGVDYKTVFDALFKDNKDAQDRISAAWDATIGNVSDFFDRMVDRAATGIDSLWNRVREPLAKVADFIQQIGIKLGLVEAGTNSWGEALRNVQNVGEKVIGGIAYGFGYVLDIFVKVGAYTDKYLVLPIVKFGSDVALVFSELARSIKDLPGIDLLIDPKKIDEAIDRIQKGIDKFDDKLKDAEKNVQDNIDRPLGFFADKFRDSIIGRREHGRELNKEREANKPPPGEPEAPVLDQVAEKFNGVLKGITASLEGSQAANQAILKSRQQQEGVGGEIIRKQAAEQAQAAKDAAKELKEHSKKLDKIAAKLDDVMVVQVA